MTTLTPLSFLPSRRCKWALFLSLASILVLAGCGRNAGTAAPDARQVGQAIQDLPVVVEETGAFDPIASKEAVKGGTFVTWGAGYPKSLNMWLDYNTFSIKVTNLMFDALIDFDPLKDEPVGLLATSWEISPDKKTYTFKIDPKATWSDGKPVTAHDVQFYYDVMMNPKNLTSLFRVDMSRFARPEVLDDRTVRITASEAHWKNFWSAGGFYALPKHVWADKDFNDINFDFPVVSGPYRLHQALTNRSISLQRRGDWWARNRRFNQHKYNFDYLVFKAEEDRTKALEMLKRGDLDMYPIFTARIWAQQTEFPQQQKNWVVRQAVYNQEPKSFQGFVMNLRRPLFQDIRVREGLARLLNRELMLDRIMFNEYFLLNSYYPDLYPNNKNPDAPVISFDPARARALFEQAGWRVDTDGILKKDGKPFEFVFLYHGEPVPQLNIYLEDLKAVGIQARIEILSAASFTKRIDEQDFDMTWSAWGASRLRDPETMWHSKTASEFASQNHAGVKDPEIDALIEAQKLEFDGAKRAEILRQIDRRLTAMMPYILIWQSDRNRLLYWNRFGTPRTVLDKFRDDESALTYWWFDPKRSAALDEARKSDTALPALPREVRYSE